MPAPYERAVITALREGILSGACTAAQIVETCLRRISHARELNAVVAVDADSALVAADRIDWAVQHRQRLGPLAGVPALVKDTEDVRGLPTTHGAELHRLAEPAHEDGLIPSILRSAGAVLVGKTNTPEFAMEAFTANRLFGVTHNPWRIGWSPGGSSGGSAAALAAGLTAVATASDGGGSTRTPAALCGLVGLKPTVGMIPHGPAQIPLEFTSPAPMANTTADLRLLLRLEARMAVGDPSAPGSLRRVRASWPRRILAVHRIIGRDQVSPSIATLFDDAVAELGRVLNAGVTLRDPGTVFSDDAVHETWAHIYAPEHTVRFGRQWLRENGPDLEPGTWEWLQFGLAVQMDEYLAARQRRLEYVRQLDVLLGEDTVLAMPTLTIEGYTADGRNPESPGEGLAASLFNTSPFNLTGHPALTVPAGMTHVGLPFGLELVGPRLGDLSLLDIAARWERACPWPVTAPGYEPILSALPLADR